MRRINTILLSLLIYMFSFFVPAAFAADAPPTAVTISTFEELIIWLGDPTGGDILLMDDIIVPVDASLRYPKVFNPSNKLHNIDAGSHTIYVEGMLMLYPPFSISGDGGENGIFNVRPGGELELAGVTIKGREGENAIVQQEGAALGHSDVEGFEFSCTGKISYAAKKVATISSTARNTPYTIMGPREKFSCEALPKTYRTYTYYNGHAEQEDLTVEWNSATFPLEDKRERTTVDGKFADDIVVLQDDTVQHLVVYQEANSPVFTNCWASVDSKSILDMNFNVVSRGKSEQIKLQASYDGEIWHDIGEELTDDYGANMWILSLEELGDKDVPPTYFSAVLTSGSGRVKYSDTIQLTSDNAIKSSDIEGGRGGETLPPPILPPPVITPPPTDDYDDFDPEEAVSSTPQIVKQPEPSSQVQIPPMSSSHSEPDAVVSVSEPEDIPAGITLDDITTPPPSGTPSSVDNPTVNSSPSMDTSSQMLAGAAATVVIFVASAGFMWRRKKKSHT